MERQALPTVAEWEYVAAASRRVWTARSGRGVPTCVAAWYSTPAPAELPRRSRAAELLLGSSICTGWSGNGPRTSTASIVTGDARGDTGLDRQLFCGAGSAGAKDTGNFPAFMRYGFRSSLKAPYTVHNLGFRCAKDL
jgi:sulfatase modifying factor 1